MKRFEDIVATFAAYAWGPWLLVLLTGGGLFFLIYSRLIPFRYFRHAIEILRGKYDDPSAPGDINHFQALSSALAGTVGMGNISGVAIAIAVGGPGAVFWMWVSAIVGMATKFFTCSLAVMYRGRDSLGHLQGGPMYVIVEGLGPRWKPLAVLFSTAGLIGCLPAFQANQLVQALREIVFLPRGWTGDSLFLFNLISGLIIAALVSGVIFGGIRRIGTVAARLVPSMVVLYFAAAIWTLLTHFSQIPAYFSLIVQDAFTGQAVAGGAVWTVMITGIRRAAFSNEAGIGTEAMAHGAAKTDEPIREGLVAMIGPFIDTIIVCTTTALMILVTGVWKTSAASGVTLTAAAFEQAIPGVGTFVLVTCVLFFSLSTMFSYSYYGSKSWAFLAGAERKHLYNYFYVILIVVASVASLDVVVNVIDGMYALMAIPTMTSALLLAPKVMKASRIYFQQLEKGRK
ncbi:MAG: alanine:cation symporter family protein [Calditrichaeota bacterium]|nr:alanine:cation symporter family protein [Calditrichota bacterium]